MFWGHSQISRYLKFSLNFFFDLLVVQECVVLYAHILNFQNCFHHFWCPALYHCDVQWHLLRFSSLICWGLFCVLTCMTHPRECSRMDEMFSLCLWGPFSLMHVSSPLSPAWNLCPWNLPDGLRIWVCSHTCAKSGTQFLLCFPHEWCSLSTRLQDNVKLSVLSP